MSTNCNKAVPAPVSHVHADVTDLLHRHLNGALTADETAQLAQILTTDPAAAAAFADLTRLDAGLSTAFKENARTVLFTRRMTRAAASLRPVRRVSIPWRPLAAAAGIAVALGGVWYFLPRDGTTPALTETKERSAPAVIEGESEPSSSGLIAAAPAPVAAAAMKRRFRGFHVPSLAVEALPVSQALTALHQQWETLPHADPASAKAVTFTITAAATKPWKSPEDEPRVTLKVPGISLYTHMELLAAQAGLKLAVTPHGAVFDADSHPGRDEVRTWSIPVPALLSSAATASARPDEDNYSIKLNLAPEVIELDGFINYGSPIQTTGTDTLGQPQLSRIAEYQSAFRNQSPLAANDDRLTRLSRRADRTSPEPAVAATVLEGEAQADTSHGSQEDLDRAIRRSAGSWYYGTDSGLIARNGFLPSSVPSNSVPSVAELLAGHWVTSVTLAFDPEAGVVNATGPVSQLKVAQALIHAMNESQSAGVALESQLLEWQDAMPPSLAAKSGEPIVVSEAQRAALVKAHPVWAANTRHTLRTRLSTQSSMGESVAGDLLARLNGEATLHRGFARTWNESTGLTADFDPSSIASNHSYRNAVDDGLLHAWFKQVKPKRELTAKCSGDLYDIDCSRLPALVEASEKSGDGSEPAMCRRLFASSLKLREGQWVQVNYPKQGADSRAFTVFLRVRAAVMSDE